MDFATLEALSSRKDNESTRKFSEKYESLRVLGNGSFGQAIQVRRREDAKKFVAKEFTLFSDEKGFTKSKRDAAVNEVSVLSKLSHPFVVRYVEAVEQPDRIFIVMEYCSGGDLGKYIKKLLDKSPSWSYLPEKQILRWTRQLVEALLYMHQNGLLHRDIKPANIFLASRDHDTSVLKIGDFGVSKILQHCDEEAATRCGTPLYFSPEMCNGLPYTAKNDIWALGCVLFELMTGKHPFSAASKVAVFRNVTKGLTANPNPQKYYSADLEVIVLSMLANDPQERPSSEALLKDTILSQVSPL